MNPYMTVKLWRDEMACIQMNSSLPEWIQAEVLRIIKAGNTAEIKKEHGLLIVVEVKRKAIKKV